MCRAGRLSWVRVISSMINDELKKPYWIARFPVTQAQFQQFVNAGGYQNPDFWPEAYAMTCGANRAKLKGLAW